MNLAHLYYFAKLSEIKNYTAAADELFISQPTLSLAISGMEKELGTKLFTKKRGVVEPTENGEAFYQYVSASLRMLENGIDYICEQTGAMNRSITIGSVYSAQGRQWSALLNAFRTKVGPDVQINIMQNTTQGALRNLKRGRNDVAFCGTMGNDPDIESLPIWTQEAALVVNRRHPFAEMESISLKCLKNCEVISYNTDGPIGAELSALVDGFNIDILRLYSDEITLCSLVAANPDTVAIACRSWLLKSFEDDVVVLKIDEAPKDFHRLYMSYRANIAHPQIVRDFIEIARGFDFSK
ncbi:LysR family transcriptional regulator [Eggerthella sp. YY7918]|uniref:LysR family transcriptional regulator n=1 Tax=Eggerthella sp. (strain YY7918) TaxID=502558 RepID=UPI00021712C5|nr:LysR family transcriptional regulator [Eggerthella sp. YY7918]BAK44202.1 hypothetical protein EGYY_10200 [Eggerthella sp. YY7918]